MQLTGVPYAFRKIPGPTAKVCTEHARAMMHSERYGDMQHMKAAAAPALHEPCLEYHA